MDCQHRGAALLGQAVLVQEPLGGVGTVDLEALVAVAVAGEPDGRAEAAEEDEFVVVGDALGGGELAGEQVAADAVVGEEGRGYPEHQLPCSRADIGVREGSSRAVSLSITSGCRNRSPTGSGRMATFRRNLASRCDTCWWKNRTKSGV